MKTAYYNSEIKINLEELIFSNKEYGAYNLRRHYEQNLSVSLFITVILFTGLLSYTLLNKNGNIKLQPTGKPKIEIPIKLINPGIEKPKPIATEIIKSKPMIKYFEPKILDDAMVPENISIPTQDELINNAIGTGNIEGDFTAVDLSTEVIPIEKPAEKENNIPFTWAEEMPRFQGGEAGLMNFLMKNIKYPDIAVKAGIKGRVILNFIVEKDGSLSDINVLKGIGGGCDEEAVRVLRLTTKWEPGKQNGMPVRVKMNIPFVFNIK